MTALMSLAVGCLIIFSVAATAEPYRPGHDDEILETVATGGGGLSSELQLIERLVARNPKNVDIVSNTVATMIRLGSERNDPYFYGRAEALLVPWWTKPYPPAAILPLRAAILQHQHAFQPALADLTVFLATHPENASARLAQATIFQVVGEFAKARAACEELPAAVEPLIAMVCVEWAESLTSDPRRAIARIQNRLNLPRPYSRSALGYAWSALGDMGRRRGRQDDAAKFFAKALAQNPTDSFALVSLADIFIEDDQPERTLDLLADVPDSDAITVRRAISNRLARRTAKQVAEPTNGKLGASQIDAIAASFAAATARKTNVHQREEAMFELSIRDQPRTAVALAKANWTFQRETVDLRLLIRAGIAAADEEALLMARNWLRTSRFFDRVSVQLLADHKNANLRGVE